MVINNSRCEAPTLKHLESWTFWFNDVDWSPNELAEVADSEQIVAETGEIRGNG